MPIFASRTGWLDTDKKYMKLQPGEFYATGMNKLPRIPLGRERGITDLANRMVVAWHVDGFRRKFLRKYQGKRLIFLCLWLFYL